MSSIAYGDLRVNRSPVPQQIDSCSREQPGAESATISAELHAANQRLHSLRNNKDKQSAGWLAALTHSLAAPTSEPEQSDEPVFTSSEYQSRASVTAHPALLTAMLQQKIETAGRVWLLARHLDEKGCGWVTVESLKKALTLKESPLRICGWRRLRQLLQTGDGIFWKRENSERLWLRSAARAGAALGITHFAGRPVELAVSTLCGDIQKVRANFYASFHSGRINAAPISRDSLTKATGVPERTQRQYDNIAGVERKSNIAIGGVVSAENRQQHYAERNGAFEFIDKRGRQGKAGKRYLAWRLPNSYSAIHPQKTTGSLKKVNRLLRQHQTDLVNLRAQGNGQATKRSRIFFEQHLSGVRAIKNRECYWYDSTTRVWHPIQTGLISHG